MQGSSLGGSGPAWPSPMSETGAPFGEWDGGSAAVPDAGGWEVGRAGLASSFTFGLFRSASSGAEGLRTGDSRVSPEPSSPLEGGEGAAGSSTTAMATCSERTARGTRGSSSSEPATIATTASPKMMSGPRIPATIQRRHDEHINYDPRAILRAPQPLDGQRSRENAGGIAIGSGGRAGVAALASSSRQTQPGPTASGAPPSRHRQASQPIVPKSAADSWPRHEHETGSRRRPSPQSAKAQERGIRSTLQAADCSSRSASPRGCSERGSGPLRRSAFGGARSALPSLPTSTSATIRRILGHLKLSVEPAPRSRARAPPEDEALFESA